nr:uncharacterized protein LOC128689205 [Cherax quadricarinatus]
MTQRERENLAPPSETSSGCLSAISEDPAGEGDGATLGHKGLSVGLGAMFLIGEMAGAGVLNLPKAIANTWWVGLPMLTVLCVAVGYSGTRLALCWVLLEERWPKYSTPCRRPYPVIAYCAFGKAGQIVTEISLGLTLFGAGTVYLLLISQLVYDLLAQLVPNISQCAWCLIIGLTLIPFTWLATPKDFWPASIAAMSSTLVACLVVIVEVILERNDHEPPVYTTPSFHTFFLGFGSILFALGGASIFPTVQNDMRDKAQFPQSIVITFLVLLALYLPLGTISYGVLGTNGMKDNILQCVTGTAVVVSKALLLCHFIFAFIIIINPVNQTLEGLLNFPNKMGVRRCLMRGAVMLGIISTGLAVPEFSKILDLVGGSTVTLMSFIMPPLCYLRLCSLSRLDGLPMRVLRSGEKVLLVLIMLVGVTGGVAATWSALQEILSPGAFTTTCFSRTTFLV